MKPKVFFQTAGVIFLIVGLLHLLRLLFGSAAVIGGWQVPMWVSVPAVVIAWYLAYTALRLGKR